jgi:HEPN domain-containing protein
VLPRAASRGEGDQGLAVCARREPRARALPPRADATGRYVRGGPERFAGTREDPHAYYIPSRYPNGLTDDVAPLDFFDAGDSERAVRACRTILDAVAALLSSAVTRAD